MFFIIAPLKDIGENGFRIFDHYLAKDKKENQFISWGWEVSYEKIMIDGKELDKSLPKKQLRKMYHQIHRKQVLVTEKRYLSQAGEQLLHSVFKRLGSFRFSIYEEANEPSTNIQFIDIGKVKEHLLLSCDITLFVSEKHHPMAKKFPPYNIKED